MYIKVIAAPGSRRELVTEVASDTLSIAVREPAKQNLANERIRTLLARRYRVPLAGVRILTGHRSRSKMVSIDR
ncbi:MAG: DUF167 domain-containing protein [Candidatus Pacebacteria bacterium]|nr:DUF167 domain-containing protein [Candidatus Paceibacterota bacterium]MBP9840618.1 DUF167 domain-containing protein [Candidatus Paceibacterota bacterium]